jgi:hypothetical protein
VSGCLWLLRLNQPAPHAHRSTAKRLGPSAHALRAQAQPLAAQRTGSILLARTSAHRSRQNSSSALGPCFSCRGDGARRREERGDVGPGARPKPQHHGRERRLAPTRKSPRRRRRCYQRGEGALTVFFFLGESASWPPFTRLEASALSTSQSTPMLVGGWGQVDVCVCVYACVCIYLCVPVCVCVCVCV